MLRAWRQGMALSSSSLWCPITSWPRTWCSRALSSICIATRIFSIGTIALRISCRNSSTGTPTWVKRGEKCHLAFAVDLGCLPMLLENEFIPVVVHVIGVLPRDGAYLPGIKEFWQMLRRLFLVALFSTFLLGGIQRPGKSSACVWSLLSLTLGLFSLWVAGKNQPCGRFQCGAPWDPRQLPTWPQCLLLGWESHSALWVLWSDWFPCQFPRSCVSRKSRKIITGSSWSPLCEWWVMQLPGMLASLFPYNPVCSLLRTPSFSFVLVNPQSHLGASSFFVWVRKKVEFCNFKAFVIHLPFNLWSN